MPACSPTLATLARRLARPVPQPPATPHNGPHGYVYVKTPDGREVREENWLWHEVTGAWPGPGEFIQHDDGFRAHNDPRNLRLVRVTRRAA